MAKKTKKSNVEVVVVPSKRAVDPGFFKAMMAFQYGEGEESNAGFEEMKRQARTLPKKE